tara:strand:- start:10 stop:183 length:174 start_codon:yes stop_codon:yes gene_type:complete
MKEKEKTLLKKLRSNYTVMQFQNWVLFGLMTGNFKNYSKDFRGEIAKTVQDIKDRKR